MIAKLVRFAIIRVSGALAEFDLMRASSYASLARPVRLPIPLKSRIAKRALRHVLLNESPRLGFSGLVLLGAWATDEARGRLMQATVANVEAFLGGKPIHVVN